MSGECYAPGRRKGVFRMAFNRDEYDERQVLARGRAFMWGFFTLMMYWLHGLRDRGAEE